MSFDDRTYARLLEEFTTYIFFGFGSDDFPELCDHCDDTGFNRVYCLRTAHDDECTVYDRDRNLALMAVRNPPCAYEWDKESGIVTLEFFPPAVCTVGQYRLVSLPGDTILL